MPPAWPWSARPPPAAYSGCGKELLPPGAAPDYLWPFPEQSRQIADLHRQQNRK